ncbi:GPI mannosyltransferase 1 [Bicyclus anynana]|uniref:GPI alpha-1,4-mannosyltransferase I, catalytic subunit n=1 Tax=Bicyclus anynana TaxID=110368 RepID=A0A6J1NQK6_BICAN|nr:GPI mannosyltransferase 1 [Bicyclus anynana]
MEKVRKILNWEFSTHLKIGALIRAVLIVYSIYHDDHYSVSYTDIDYKVFTDAAKHVYKGDSPYKRHTYRYSPLIAFMLLPNVFYTRTFGKQLFCVFDVFVAIALKILVERQLKNKENASKIAKYCSLFWIYNPMSIAISSRGNADSVPCFFVILSILFLQTDVIKNLFKYVLSGIFLGFSIHLRMYPLALSFPMYLSLGEYNINRNTRLLSGILSLVPNRKQLLLAFSCILTLFSLTYVMYAMYGYEFLFETYIYHLFRKDTRHNFSVLFYYSYLTIDDFSFDAVKTISQVFEGIILFVVSLTFGTKQETLPFALFCQPVVLVVYNSVMTSQYFIWFLSLLPLVVHSFEMRISQAFVLFTLWLSSQGAWLFYAYLLEFKSREVFLFIWLKGVVFFCANIYILAQLIKCYRPGYGFGLISKTNEIKSQ